MKKGRPDPVAVLQPQGPKPQTPNPTPKHDIHFEARVSRDCRVLLAEMLETLEQMPGGVGNVPELVDVQWLLALLNPRP